VKPLVQSNFSNYNFWLESLLKLPLHLCSLINPIDDIPTEEQLLRDLADTGAISNIILEGYTSKNLIQRDKSNQTTWSTMGGQFILECIPHIINPSIDWV
jgi:hypothetical protein